MCLRNRYLVYLSHGETSSNLRNPGRVVLEKLERRLRGVGLLRLRLPFWLFDTVSQTSYVYKHFSLLGLDSLFRYIDRLYTSYPVRPTSYPLGSTIYSLSFLHRNYVISTYRWEDLKKKFLTSTLCCHLRLNLEVLPTHSVTYYGDWLNLP